MKLRAFCCRHHNLPFPWVSQHFYFVSQKLLIFWHSLAKDEIIIFTFNGISTKYCMFVHLNVYYLHCLYATFTYMMGEEQFGKLSLFISLILKYYFLFKTLNKLHHLYLYNINHIKKSSLQFSSFYTFYR